MFSNSDQVVIIIVVMIIHVYPFQVYVEVTSLNSYTGYLDVSFERDCLKQPVKLEVLNIRLSDVSVFSNSD